MSSDTYIYFLTGAVVIALTYVVCCIICVLRFIAARSTSERLAGLSARLAAFNPDHRESLVVRKQLQILRRKHNKKLEKRKKQLNNATFAKSSSCKLPKILRQSCPICFEDYSGNRLETCVGYLCNCRHHFHYHCIWKWLENNNANCPLCRQEFELTVAGVQAYLVYDFIDLIKRQNAEKRRREVFSVDIPPSTVSSVGCPATNAAPIETTETVAV